MQLGFAKTNSLTIELIKFEKELIAAAALLGQPKFCIIGIVKLIT